MCLTVMSLLLVTSVLGADAPGTSAVESDSPTALRMFTTRQEANDCGAKCLFLLCRSLGMDLTEDAVRRHCRIESQGMSLADVCSAAADCGVRLEGVFANSDELAKLALPAICLLEGDSVSGSGHYVVVLGIDGNTVKMLDPRFGSILNAPLTAFTKSSSGCYLVRRHTRRWWGLLGGGLLVVMAVVLLFWQRTRHRQFGAVASILCVIAAGGCSDSAPAAKTYVAPPSILDVEQPRIDLGAVGNVPTHTVEFVLINRGSVPLTLDLAKTCGCIETRLTPNSALAAESRATLEVRIATKEKHPGSFIDSVFVRAPQIGEERRLDISGQIEGVWVNSTGLTLHTSDRQLPMIEVEGFFTTKNPKVEWLELSLGIDDVTGDLEHPKQTVTSRYDEGFHHRWSIPLTVTSDAWKSLRGRRLARLTLRTSDAEKTLEFPVFLLP